MKDSSFRSAKVSTVNGKMSPEYESRSQAYPTWRGSSKKAEARLEVKGKVAGGTVSESLIWSSGVSSPHGEDAEFPQLQALLEKIL